MVCHRERVIMIYILPFKMVRSHSTFISAIVYILKLTLRISLILNCFSYFFITIFEILIFLLLFTSIYFFCLFSFNSLFALLLSFLLLSFFSSFLHTNRNALLPHETGGDRDALYDSKQEEELLLSLRSHRRYREHR